MSPDPELDVALFSGGEFTGWISFQAYQDGKNLLLVFEPPEDESPTYFIALEDGASVGVSPDLANIQADEIGINRSEPAEFGTNVTTEDWQITVLESKRGEDAWLDIIDANQFNDEPEPGFEYIMAFFQVRYLATNPVVIAERITNHDFRLTGNEGALYDIPSVVSPDPELDIYLYLGGIFEGWVVLTAQEGAWFINSQKLVDTF